MPNLGTPPGFIPVQQRFIRGQISKVLTDGMGRPNFLFDVRPVGGAASTGTRDNELHNVLMLQPGFGNIGDSKHAPTGVIYVPEVGSRVLMIYDGSRYVIVGFYTGPHRRNTTVLDAGQSYDPGIELAINNLFLPSERNVPWLFGIEPGDIIFGKDLARVKLCSRGVILSGAGTAGLIALKSDGEMLTRFSSREDRGVGFWRRLAFQRGATDAQYIADPDTAPVPIDGLVYDCRVIEASPYSKALAPYIIEQAGHISRAFINRGRTSVYATSTAQVLFEEAKSKDHAVIRKAVIQPITDQTSADISALELDSSKGTSFEVFDFQADANGSFRLRGGNKSKKKGGQGPAPTKEMDVSLEYNAKSNGLLVRIGQAGAETTVFNLTPKEASITTKGSASISAESDISVETKKTVSVTAKELDVTGATNLNGKLNVSEEAIFSKELIVGTSAVVGGPVFATKFVQVQSSVAGIPTNLATVQAMNSNTALTGDFATVTSTLATQVNAGFMTPLSALSSMSGKSFLTGAQGLSLFQGLGKFQGIKAVQTMQMFTALGTSLGGLHSAGLVGPNGTVGINLIAGLNGLGGFPGGFAGFSAGADLSVLASGAGATFLGGLATFLGTGSIQTGLDYLHNVMDHLSNVLSLSTASADLSLSIGGGMCGLALSAGLPSLNFMASFNASLGLSFSLSASLSLGGQFICLLKGLADMIANGGLKSPLNAGTFLAGLATDMQGAGLLVSAEVTGQAGIESSSLLLDSLTTFST